MTSNGKSSKKIVCLGGRNLPWLGPGSGDPKPPAFLVDLHGAPCSTATWVEHSPCTIDICLVETIWKKRRQTHANTAINVPAYFAVEFFGDLSITNPFFCVCLCVRVWHFGFCFRARTRLHCIETERRSCIVKRSKSWLRFLSRIDVRLRGFWKDQAVQLNSNSLSL